MEGVGRVGDEVPLLTGEAMRVWQDLEGQIRAGSVLALALPWLLAGHSYRSTAARVGRPWQQIWDAVRSRNLTGAVRRCAGDRVGRRVEEAAELATEAVVNRLMGEEDVELKQLAIVAGIMVDKHAAREGWGAKRGDAAGGLAGYLERIAGSIERGESRVTLSWEATDAVERARDVTGGRDSEEVEEGGVGIVAPEC